MGETGLFLRGEYRGNKKLVFEEKEKNCIEHSIETVFPDGSPKPWKVKDYEEKFHAEKGQMVEVKITAQAGLSNRGTPFLIYKIPEENRKPIKKRTNERETSDRRQQRRSSDVPPWDRGGDYYQ